MLEDKLEIIIITYNRKKYLQRTLEKLLEDSSPVKNLSITILDNNSTDETGEYLDELSKKYNNVKHIANKYNVGGNANFAKAVELAESEYFWILGDDDLLDFSNWSEVESALNNNYDMVFMASKQYEEQIERIFKEFPQFEKSKDKEYIIKGILAAHFIFISSSIYKKSIVDDLVMRNIYDTTCTMCPQSALFCKILNEERPYYVLKNGGIVYWGCCDDDVSYTRGYDKHELNPRSTKITFFAGVANALEILKDKKLKKYVMSYFFDYTKCAKHLYTIVKSDLRLYNQTPYNIADLIMLAPAYYKFMLILGFLPCAVLMVWDKLRGKIKNVK